MKKWWILALVFSIFLGSLLSGTSILADPEDKGNPFDKLQKQIDDIVNGNTSIDGESKMLFLGSGISSEKSTRTSYACGQLFRDEPLNSCSRNIPLDGKVTDFTASSVFGGHIVSPGIGKSYQVTLVKNGIDTDLSCVISDNETSCQNTKDSVSVSIGDVIDFKITSEGSPDRANIAASGLLRP